ncbi:MAG: ACP S-malonyltransferase [Alphaproteobacteria bacterium]|nr:ACP S-malonyltransferase [Alphaproteobacteria bacterium]
MKRCMMFPGQGSQYVGMAQAIAQTFAEAREVLEQVDDALNQNLSRLMAQGPEEDLTLTENAQPALMAASMAVMAVLQKQAGITVASHAQYVAGHSLGEYTALTAAGALSLSDAARVLKLRGQAMQRAVAPGIGAMAAILGPSLEEVQALARDAAGTLVCQVANDNSVGQVVISGHKEAVEAAIALASTRGAKRAVLLPVSAPFHCSLMEPAAHEMKEALAAIDLRAPSVPVVANVTAQAETDSARIRDLLVAQVTGQVRWRESVLWMKEQDVGQMIEFGAGKVLCGLVRRIDKDIQCLNAETPEDIEALINTLK